MITVLFFVFSELDGLINLWKNNWPKITFMPSFIQHVVPNMYNPFETQRFSTMLNNGQKMIIISGWNRNSNFFVFVLWRPSECNRLSKKYLFWFWDVDIALKNGGRRYCYDILIKHYEVRMAGSLISCRL